MPLFIAFVLLIVGMFGCVIYNETHRTPEEQARVDSRNDWLAGRVILEAGVAPDGTKLWKKMEDNRVIYFSSRGTNWETQERSGKSSRTEYHQVPNAE